MAKLILTAMAVALLSAGMCGCKGAEPAQQASSAVGTAPGKGGLTAQGGLQPTRPPDAGNLEFGTKTGR